MSPATALLAGLALVAGSVFVVTAAVLAAAAIAARINPEPDVPVEDRIERAEDEHRRREAHEERMRQLERRSGRESIDSTHLVFPTFGIVFVLFMCFGAWSAVLDHADAGGGPVPVSVLLRPLWLPWIPALIAGLIAAAGYRRAYERWPQWKKDLEAERRRAKRHRGHRSRLDGLRRSASRRRSDRY
ncbi:hypothetical protein [Glycomyces tarimensis]